MREGCKTPWSLKEASDKIRDDRVKVLSKRKASGRFGGNVFFEAL